jgi:CheY-like chemotaxis protein
MTQETTHILIAEDNPGDVRLIRLALEETKNWPTHVSVARDGEQAIAMLEARAGQAGSGHTPGLDLIILDYNLPKRSGAEVLKMIRRTEPLQTIPVVVLSSSPEYFLREKMQGANVEATCYITKPPDFDEFLQLGDQIRRCYETGR